MTENSDSERVQNLPSLRVTMDMTTLVKYSAATWDFHRYHYDATFARSVGMPAPFVDGQMFGALLARVAMSWAGPEAFLRRLVYRQDATVYLDETIVVTGTAKPTTIENGIPFADLDLSISRHDGLPIIRNAFARVQMTHGAAALHPTTHTKDIGS